MNSCLFSPLAIHSFFGILFWCCFGISIHGRLVFFLTKVFPSVLTSDPIFIIIFFFFILISISFIFLSFLLFILLLFDLALNLVFLSSSCSDRVAFLGFFLTCLVLVFFENWLILVGTVALNPLNV